MRTNINAITNAQANISSPIQIYTPEFYDDFAGIVSATAKYNKIAANYIVVDKDLPKLIEQQVAIRNLCAKLQLKIADKIKDEYLTKR
jgi:hypothetical protein